MVFNKEQLNSFPTSPGVYIMKGTRKEVLYVGKAKNLRQRVKQYFIPGRDGRFMIPFLVAKVCEIETIVVTSEKEALLLENTLIKKHKPKYNAIFKDDKSYIALKITKHEWPMIQLIRYKGKPKADGTYFGPYTSAFAARQTFELINKVFPMRQCSDQELRRRTRPCILYDMGRCVAPCVGKCTREEYDDHVNRAMKFLRGQDKEVVKELHKRIQNLSDNLEFEKAGALLRIIRDIEKTIEVQHVDKPLGHDADVFAIFREGDEVILSQLFFRGGKLIGSRQHNFSKLAQDDQELLASFLVQKYELLEDLPHEILLPKQIKGHTSLEEILSAGKRRKVHIHTPQRGEKKRLIEIAYNNAKATFQKEKDATAIRERTLMEMQEKLRLNRYPRVIECFDNSNLSGTNPVSSMVTYKDGQRDTNRYRLYKVKPEIASDDYGAMQEVLSRRYKRAKEENSLPDLLVIDGGKGHLNIALNVLSDLDIVTFDVIGIAKEGGRHDKGATSEQVFLRNVKDPVKLGRNSSVLFFLQQIRDEAHRTAIGFQKKRRSKTTIKSLLDEIPGIGPVKKKKLIRHFGSVKKVLEASAEELRKVPGISDANVEAIRRVR